MKPKIIQRAGNEFVFEYNSAEAAKGVQSMKVFQHGDKMYKIAHYAKGVDGEFSNYFSFLVIGKEVGYVEVEEKHPV